MATAIHVPETKKLDYDYKDFEKVKWMAYKACIVLQDHQKWMENATMTEGKTKNWITLKDLSSSASNDVPN